MTLAIRFGRTAGILALGGAVLAGSIATSTAQQESFSVIHIAAARDAVAASGYQAVLDGVLPGLVNDLTAILVDANPAQEATISSVVAEAGANLTDLRAELDSVVHRVWAAYLSEADLRALTAFFGTEAGLRVAAVLPTMIAETNGAATDWESSIAEALVASSFARLEAEGVTFEDAAEEAN
jgi:hypothetical protein